MAAHGGPLAALPAHGAAHCCQPCPWRPCLPCPALPWCGPACLPCHIPAHAQPSPHGDSVDLSCPMPAKGKPHDWKWSRLAKRHLAQHPHCAFAGCPERATDVDHIVPISAAPHRRLDPTNLQSLCHSHHSQLTSAYDVGRLDGACDVDGNTLDPAHPWAAETMPDALRKAADSAYAARLKQAVISGRRR